MLKIFDEQPDVKQDLPDWIENSVLKLIDYIICGIFYHK